MIADAEAKGAITPGKVRGFRAIGISFVITVWLTFVCVFVECIDCK